MKRLITLLIMSVFASVTIGLTPLALVPAFADTPKNEVCQGVGLGTGCGDSGAQANHAIDVAVTLLALIAGIAAVIMIIVSGLRFITAGGDASKVAAARNSIIYALIGLVVIAAARTIVHYILGQVSGV